METRLFNFWDEGGLSENAAPSNIRRGTVVKRKLTQDTLISQALPWS